MAHKDPRGQVIALTNSTSKSVGQTYRYSSWGERPGGGATGFNNLDRARWKGASWFEEIGLYYMRARWYDPSLGQFISEDPTGLEGGINNYVFGEGDPINMADPEGTLAASAGDLYSLECFHVMGKWLCRPIWLDPIGGATSGTDGFEFDYGPGARGGSGFYGGAFAGDQGVAPTGGRSELVDVGAAAEAACARAIFFGTFVVATDVVFSGAAAFKMVANGWRWARRVGRAQGSRALGGWDGGLELSVLEARRATIQGARGLISDPALETVQFGGAVAGGLEAKGVLGALAGFIPFVSAGQALVGAYETCFNPGG